MENIASVKSRIESYLSSAAQVAPAAVEQPSKQGTNTPNVKQPKSILVNRSEGGMSGKTMKLPKLIHNGEGESKNLKIYAQSATDISAEEEDNSNCSNRETNKLRFSTNQQDHLLQVPKHNDREKGMLLGGVRKSKSFATPGQFECAMDDHQIDEKKRTMMAFFTSQQQQTVLHPPHDAQSTLKSTRKISQPAMHIHAGGGGGSNDVQLRNADLVRPNVSTTNRNIKRSSISDEIIGDEDLQDVDAVFESLLTSTFSESESSSSVPGPRSARRVHKQEQQVRPGARKAELGKSSSIGGERIGNIREEQEDLATRGANGNTAISSQTSNSKNAVISSRKTSSVTRKPSKSKLVTGEVKLSAIPSSVEHMQQQNAVIRSEKQQLPRQKQPCASGCDEREKVAKDRKIKSDPNRKSSSEKQEGLVIRTTPDMYKKAGGNIPNDPLGSLPTSHTKKYLPRQQTWAGPQGSTPPPPYSPSPTQSEYESCDPWDDY